MKFHSLGNTLGEPPPYHALALLASLALFSGPLRAASDDGQINAGTVGAARAVLELEFSKDCPDLRRVFLLMATEAGIDIALFWNAGANRYDVC